MCGNYGCGQGPSGCTATPGSLDKGAAAGAHSGVQEKDCSYRTFATGRSCAPKLGRTDGKLHYAVLVSVLTVTGAGLVGCVLAPQGTTQERSKLSSVASSFEPPIDTRQLPPLPVPADWPDVLSRAFLVNGELESAPLAAHAADARHSIPEAVRRAPFLRELGPDVGSQSTVGRQAARPQASSRQHTAGKAALPLDLASGGTD
jgi:hypothetical protein